MGKKRCCSALSCQTPEVEGYEHDNACRNRGSSAYRLADSAEQDHNGHAFQTSADISAEAHGDAREATTRV
jgi:hypothetical protein